MFDQGKEKGKCVPGAWNRVLKERKSWKKGQRCETQCRFSRNEKLVCISRAKGTNSNRKQWADFSLLISWFSYFPWAYTSSYLSQALPWCSLRLVVTSSVPFLDPLLRVVHSLVTTSSPSSSPTQMLRHQRFLSLDLEPSVPFSHFHRFPCILDSFLIPLRLYHPLLDLVEGPFLHLPAFPR